MPFDVYSQAGADAAFATAAQGARADTAVQPVALAAGLAGKVGKGDLVINVKDYGAVGDGTTDDAAAIQAAIAAASGAGRPARVWMPEGTYRVGSSIVLPAGHNLSLEGDGEGRTIINASLPAVAFPDMANVISTEFASRAALGWVTPTADLAVGARTIPVPDASAARVGDLVLVNTSIADPEVSGYTLGAYRVVVSISGNTLTVDEPLERDYPLATAAPLVYVVATHTGTRIGRFTLNLVKGANHRGILLRGAVGGLVHEVTINGNGTKNEGTAGNSSMGIDVDGQNIRVERCTARDFHESTNSYGYGIVLAGNGNIASRNRVERCKHGIAAGNSSRRCQGLILTENVAIDAQIEAHGSCEDVLISNNIVTVTNAPAYGTLQGIWVRAHRTTVTGNTIKGAKTPGVATTIGGIRIIGSGWDHAVISGNLIYGFTYGIYNVGDTYAKHSNVLVTSNVISVEGRGIYFAKGSVGCVIANNVIDAGGSGIEVGGMAQSVIEGNRIKYGRVGYGIGIEVNPAKSAGDTGTYVGLTIAGNVVTYANGSGVNGGAIRLFGKQNKLSITGNVVDYAGTAGAEQIRVGELDAGTASEVTISGNAGNLGAELRPAKAAAPTAGFHRAGETVQHSAPVEAGTDGSKYIITGWVCVTEGTPGTWLPMRSLTGG